MEDCAKNLDKKLNIAQQVDQVKKPEEAIVNEGDEGEDGGEPVPEDVKQMQKMMEQMLAGMGGPGGMPGGQNMDPSANPFMSAVNQMFKDFEQVSKEGGGAPVEGAGDPKLDEFLSSLTKDLFSGT